MIFLSVLSKWQLRDVKGLSARLNCIPQPVWGVGDEAVAPLPELSNSSLRDAYSCFKANCIV